MVKKNIVFASVGALIIDILGLLINLVCALTIKSMPLAREMTGGEYIAYQGFGILYEKIFFITAEEISDGVDTRLSFDIVNFIYTVIVIFIILFIVKIVIDKLKSKK